MKSHVYTNRYTFLLLPLLLHFTVGSSSRSQENSRIKSKGKIPTSNIQFGPSHPIKLYVSHPIKMVNSANSWEIQKKSYLKKKLFHPIKSKKCPLKSQGFGCLVAEEDAEAATRVAPQVQGRARDVRKIRKSSNPKPKQTWKNTSYTGKIWKNDHQKKKLDDSSNRF